MPERFTAVLGERHVVVPLDVRALWGEARPPVRGTVNGVPFRSRLAVYGGETMLGLTNAFRASAGIAEGDEVEVPPALQAALEGDAIARAAYERLSFTHRREYANWIAEAKQETTRSRRTERALEMLREGVRTPG